MTSTPSRRSAAISSADPDRPMYNTCGNAGIGGAFGGDGSTCGFMMRCTYPRVGAGRSGRNTHLVVMRPGRRRGQAVQSGRAAGQYSCDRATCLVPWKRDSYDNSRAGHPASRRCSSLTYAQYARSSRLAIRAPRSGTSHRNHASRGLAVRPVVKRSERALARSRLCQLQDDERVSIVPTLRNAVASTPLVPSVLVFVS